MKIYNYYRSVCLLVLLASGLIVSAHAQTTGTSSSSLAAVESSAASMSAVSSVAASSLSSEWQVESDDFDRHDRDWSRFESHRWEHRHGNELVGIGHSVTLPAGQKADSVVAIMGSATSEGEVSRDVVSVMGSTRVTGPVGHDVVSVMGSSYINSKIGHDVVAVLGNVSLGPQAVIDGQLVAIGGAISRDPAAVVRGGVQGVSSGFNLSFDWLKPWIDNCLLYGRPLALAPGLGWAWTLAMLSLLFYVLTALMAPRAVDRCVTTLEESPGYSLLTALLATMATPLVFVLLVVTVIGIVAIPFLGIALLCLGFFGKLVMLAWLGRRVTSLFGPLFGNGVLAHAAIATLIGGLIVTALYLVPVLGFVVYKLLGFIGFGVVAYTLILNAKQHRQNGRASTGAGAMPGAGGNNQTSSQDQTSGQAGDPSGDRMQDAAAQASFAGSNGDTTHAAGSSSASSAAPEPATMDAISLPRATFWMRMGALLLDLVLVAFILKAILDIDDVLLLVVAVYGAVMWKFKGTTIGGILFNLRVVRLDGRELDWPTAIVRSLSCFLSLIALGLGFIWIAVDPDRQAWHDKIAGTVVVRTPKGVSLV